MDRGEYNYRRRCGSHDHSSFESRGSAGKRRVPAEQDRALKRALKQMRIVKLTDAVAAKFLARRSLHDAAAERIAARILADVRENGDVALFRWAKRLDRVHLTRKSLWISRKEILDAKRNVSRDLVRAI